MSDIGLPRGMTKDDAYVQGMADGEDAFYKDIRDSFRLAMESAGVSPEIVTEVLTTVDDYVDNHY
jgi:hypothetical protein